MEEPKANKETEVDIDRRIEGALRDLERHAEGDSGVLKDAVPVSLSKFSHILHLLSQKAEIATERDLKMQKRLLFLTWALVCLTFVLLAIAVVQTKVMIKENSSTHAETKQKAVRQ